MLSHFVSTSILTFKSYLPTPSFPISCVFCLYYFKKKNDAKSEEFGEIYAFIPAYFKNGRLGTIIVAYVQVIVGVATKQMSNATRRKPHWLIMLLN